MVSEKVTLINPQGLHMRPAGTFASAMGKFASTVTVVADGKETNGTSPMALMAAGLSCGTEIEIKCDGADEADHGGSDGANGARAVVDFNDLDPVKKVICHGWAPETKNPPAADQEIRGMVVRQDQAAGLPSSASMDFSQWFGSSRSSSRHSTQAQRLPSRAALPARLESVSSS